MNPSSAQSCAYLESYISSMVFSSQGKRMLSRLRHVIKTEVLPKRVPGANGLDEARESTGLASSGVF